MRKQESDTSIEEKTFVLKEEHMEYVRFYENNLAMCCYFFYGGGQEGPMPVSEFTKMFTEEKGEIFTRAQDSFRNRFPDEYGEVYKDTMDLEILAQKLNEEEIDRFVHNKKVRSLVRGIKEKYNCDIDRVALFILGKYVSEIVQNRLVIKLAPQPSDYLDDIKKIKKIVFHNDNNHTVTIADDLTIGILQDALKACQDKNYAVKEEKSTAKDVFKPEIYQSEFVHYLASFFNQRFTIKRRKDAVTTTMEQELISLLMCHVGLSKTNVDDSRYRHLRNRTDNFRFRGFWLSPDAELYNKTGWGAFVLAELVKYKDWKRGQFSVFTNEMSEMELGDQIIL